MSIYIVRTADVHIWEVTLMPDEQNHLRQNFLLSVSYGRKAKEVIIFSNVNTQEECLKLYRMTLTLRNSEAQAPNDHFLLQSPTLKTSSTL